ncbi:MAG: DM13 domain-containing protein [Nitrosopumilus sp.]|nr:DM13 domain-containing protein [Nitrosopumilus sp.]MDH3735979.1 DM13 domain-containing protein [Nitrosopumilus sp.]MDH3823044.1 DM13 domain-containing protein [Nitrosopumilus sp.]MDH3833943.1 DM13 domain-containing protein [Nitrosopumilus sp.]
MNKGILIGIIVGIIVIGGGLASPLFYETEINESLPTALDNIESGLTLETFSNMDDNQRQTIIEKMPEKVKDMIMEESAKITLTVSEDMDEMIKEESSNELKIIKTGTFEGLAGHQAEGIAKILEVNGESFLRFEEFDVTNGPDLRVYLTPNGDVHDGIHLDKLKGSKGNQNYSLEGIDTDVYDTVIIYCQPFGAYFGQAELN